MCKTSLRKDIKNKNTFFYSSTENMFVDLFWERERNIDAREISITSHICPIRGSNIQPLGMWDDTPKNWTSKWYSKKLNHSARAKQKHFLILKVLKSSKFYLNKKLWIILICSFRYLIKLVPSSLSMCYQVSKMLKSLMI